MTMQELSPQIYEALRHLCADGDYLAASGKFEEAIGEYNRAWEIVPEPKNEWDGSAWLLAAIAEVAILGGFTTSAREALEYAMTCPGAIGNPSLHLRLGQALFDIGEHDRAADELMRAYMGGGADLFATEDERYLSFLRTRAVLD
jgi:tetratricopeptide (TPR) repeat protein